MTIDLDKIPSPCFVVEEEKLEANAKLLADVQERAGCKILLALKGFAMFSTFDLLGKYLKGTTASSINEALLGHHEFGGELHGYCPAYTKADFNQWLDLCDHIVFNSFSQWETFREEINKHKPELKAGIRINPEHSEVETDLYNPCFTHSRLGVTLANFKADQLEGISGLHFHTLCEKNSDALERTIEVIEKKFGSILKDMQWVNFGGGHHITRPDYDVEKLITIIKHIKSTYDVDVYLEPGEAVALNCGVLVASVVDLLHNEMDIAMLDTSASAHMPDVLEMPYRPVIDHADEPGKKKHTYRLGGMTCLAGDVIGDYSFDEPLSIGDKLVFNDMAHYSMVKTTMFNGVNLPHIGIWRKDGSFDLVRSFGYKDYRNRLS